MSLDIVPRSSCSKLKDIQSEIRRMTNHHMTSTTKENGYIDSINEQGIKGIVSKFTDTNQSRYLIF